MRFVLVLGPEALTRVDQLEEDPLSPGCELHDCAVVCSCLFAGIFWTSVGSVALSIHIQHLNKQEEGEGDK